MRTALMDEFPRQRDMEISGGDLMAWRPYQTAAAKNGVEVYGSEQTETPAGTDPRHEPGHPPWLEPDRDRAPKLVERATGGDRSELESAKVD